MYFHMLPFIALCVPSRAGHVEVVRAIYPYVAQHVSWCQPRRPDLETWAELLQYHHTMYTMLYAVCSGVQYCGRSVLECVIVIPAGVCNTAGSLY